MTITGFKSTDIESRSKVEPATVTNLGYKRQGLDVNAITGLFFVTAATCSAGTTSSIAVMTPASTVMAGDVLDFNGIRSEISLVSGTSYTLGRAITGLTNGSSVNIYRPSYLLVDSTGAVALSGTPNINLAQVGGVSTSLGQKAEASSIPVVLATEQDVAKNTTIDAGNCVGLATWDSFNLVWQPFPCDSTGTPIVSVARDGSGAQTQLATRSVAPGASDEGVVTRNIPSGTQAVSGTVTAALPATVSTTGNITASAQTIPVILGELKFVTLDISGTYGSVALAFEVSLDGTIVSM